MSRGILHGLRVLDMSNTDAGRCSALILADHGAEVVRIEPEIDSDPEQTESSSRNKKSVLLNVAEQDSQSALRALIASCDVLLCETDPCGMTFSEMCEINPELVFGKLPLSDAEPSAGPAMAFGVLAALRTVDSTGTGQIVDMTDVSIHPKGGLGVRFSAFPTPELAPAPRAGQDTDRYLSEMPPAPISETDRRALRDVFGAFATGVTVITTLQDDGTPRGFTANSFTSVSLDPPIVLVCIAKTAHSCTTFTDASHFAINVLHEDQKGASGLFASRDPDKFDQVSWHGGAAAMPLLDGALATIVCAQEKVVNAGDHVILLGRVIDHTATSGSPLGYFRGNYFSVGLEDDLVLAAAKSGAVEIGALLARGPQVLLRVDSEGHLTVPRSDAKPQTLPALRTYLKKLGLQAKLDFLYAVYQDSVTGRHGIYYHGAVIGRAPAGFKFFNLVDIPFARVSNPAERSMLKRYAEEFRHGTFGIYQGDETHGTVHKIMPPAHHKT